MTTDALNERIIALGERMFADIAGETPAVFNRKEWLGQVMEWCMRHEEFKVQLFRFVDAFPSLTTPTLLADHIRDYFGGDDSEIPAVLKWGAKTAGWGGGIGAGLLAKVFKSNIEEMARIFIVGETIPEALARLARLRADGFAAVIDFLGEATLSDEEADEYASNYLAILDALQAAHGEWTPLGNGSDGNGLDWRSAPQINVAVKPTALCSQANPMDFEGSVSGVLERLRRIYAKVRAVGGFLCIDMESYRFKEITLEVFRRLRLETPEYPHLGIALQAYLKESDADLEKLIYWARRQSLTISIRLVKGAYWDYETVRSQQNGWHLPVYTDKASTDAAFERLAGKALAEHRFCHLACGSHNIRSIAAVIEMARELRVPEERYEFQVLYGMAEPVRRALLKSTGRVRLYAPFGRLVPGMGYLVRRLLENTANESFLRQSFTEGAEMARLLADPAHTATKVQPSREAVVQAAVGRELLVFRNEPAADFTRADLREAFPKALRTVRDKLGTKYSLFINGREVRTDDLLPSSNPARPTEVIGLVSQAGPVELHEAIGAASAAFPKWRDTSVRERAAFLMKAADLARRRIIELAAWQVLEIGKQWDQAYADVAEAIDFLEYYSREMMRLDVSQRRPSAVPGEDNRYLYEPRGVAAVIAPWNFPLAISCGMAAAAVITGNTVVYKPSGLTPLVGHQLMTLFRDAGLPAGVFNFLPGRSSVIGDLLVDHPAVSLIVFTGSMEVGTRIVERAARLQPGQDHLKKVVCEMGGKNAVIVDDDADLDEAIPHILQSAFGFQGQKCSACSRVIVLDAVYDQFVRRFVAAAQALRIGPAEDPAYFMGPVADEVQQRKILEYIELAGREGNILYRSNVPEGCCYVPLTIVGGIRPEHRTAQEEIFGPVLAIMRAQNFDEALVWANGTRFALTGGVFSRSPSHLERARREFLVGNLYLNRGCTGALVERQPFGGGRLSGTGTKAGGPDYLLHFLEPRVVTENTMRRGFAPQIRK